MKITASSLYTFRKCPRAYLYQYEQGYVPAKDSEALRFGSMFHEAIEMWIKAGRNVEQIIAQFEIPDDPEEKYLIYKLIGLLRGYDMVYHNEPYEYLKVEAEFTAPLINPDTMRQSKTCHLAGKIDRLVKDSSGRVYLVETKTTGDDLSPESDYWRRLMIDGQVSGYYVGAEVLGYKVESCLYDVIRKPTIRLKQNETPEQYADRLFDDIKLKPAFYFARREIPRSQTDLSDYLFDVWHTVQTIQSYQKKAKFPRYTSNCMTPYKCRYFGVCCGMENLDDPEVFRKSEKKHQELKQGE